MTPPDRAALVEHARRSIAMGSKSFRAASRLFDRATRERAWLLYAWCRACDDLADGQVMGHGMHAVDDAQERLAIIRARTSAAFRGDPTGDAAFDGFGVVARECGITPALADDLIEGFALDADGWRPADEEGLLRYCYHVAGVVGVMMALVMGIAPDGHATLGRACDLGLAFQLANIARDVTEDARAGRCYLPATWLAEEGVALGALLDPASRPALARILQRLADRAAVHEASARIGAGALSFRSAWAVLAAAGIYGDIVRKAARRGEAALDARVVTGKPAKLGWFIRAGWQAVRLKYLSGKKREAGRQPLEQFRPRAGQAR